MLAPMVVWACIERGRRDACVRASRRYMCVNWRVVQGRGGKWTRDFAGVFRTALEFAAPGMASHTYMHDLCSPL